MADASINTSANDNLLASYFERRVARTLIDEVYYYQAVQKDGLVFQIPQGEGQQITWNAWRRLAAASSFLAESSGNNSANLSSRKVNVTVNSLGRAIKMSDLVEFTSTINVNEGAMRMINDSAALTVDNCLQYAVNYNYAAFAGNC